MNMSYSINPIGVVRKTDDDTRIEIFDEYTDGLLGLAGFSHIHVFYWFDQNDTPEKRQTLQVHPRKDRCLCHTLAPASQPDCPYTL